MAGADSAPPGPTFTLPARTLVVDAGAHTIKAGLVSWQDEEKGLPAPQIIPNCIARSRGKRDYIGSALSQCRDFGEMQFKRPIERGYIVNWDLQRAIFEHEFLEPKAPLYCDPSATSLILTEPSNGPAALSSNADQIVFEEFGFAAASRINGPSLNALNPLPASLSSEPSLPASLSPPIEVLLVIDSSHSATTITPLLRGCPIHRAVRRITLGGKHITNYLAELISLRHFRLVDDPYIVEQIKHDACFVSNDFARDIERCWRGPRGDRRRTVDEDIVIDYVLPDYDRVQRGFVRQRPGGRGGRRRAQQQDSMKARTFAKKTDADSRDAMILDDKDGDGDGDGDGDHDEEEEKKEGEGVCEGGTSETFPMANERFVAPELLFNPLDIGLRESGICDTVMQSLAQVPQPLWQGLLANVICVGGNTLLPGFVERVQSGLEALVPCHFSVCVAAAAAAAAGEGGAASAGDPITASWRGGARLAASERGLKVVLVSREEYLERGEGWVLGKIARNRIVSDWADASGS